MTCVVCDDLGCEFCPKTKSSKEYGWLSIGRTEYEKMHAREYAGPGTPLHPDAPGYWVMTRENEGTVLYTGVTIDENA